MQTLNINSGNCEATFLSLESISEGTLKSNQTAKELTFDNALGNGTITGFNFNKNIVYYTYDVQFNEDTTLVFHNNSDYQSLSHYYCSSGDINHSFGASGKMMQFSEMQIGIFSNSVGESSHLYFQKGQYHKFSLINFVASKPITESADEFTGQLMQLFQSKEKEGRFAYACSHNLKIQENINQLESLSQNNLAHAILKKGILQVSLGLIVNQYFEDLKAETAHAFTLSQKEMESIKEISEFIKNYPDQSFDLKYLSDKTGLTPAKLQQGFKELFGRTVSSFIKNVRVELAENLIKTTDLNISEVVYTIGLSSRSYFSKIFKEKYNCSPKQYQENKYGLELMSA